MNYAARHRGTIRRIVRPARVAISQLKPFGERFHYGVFAVVLLAGCGPSFGTLHGTVTFNGRPLERGLVTARPADGEGTSEGTDVIDGKFSLPRLTPGKYQVHIEGYKEPIITQPGGPESLRTLTPEEIRAQSDPLPVDTRGKDQTVDVVAGEQKVEFKLTAP